MKNYLPIGSIVLLKGGTKKLMIYGRKQVSIESGRVFDYIACFYPEGNISDQYTFLFDHTDIEKVIFTGYADVDEREFSQIILKES